MEFKKQNRGAWGREGKKNKMKSERETNLKRLTLNHGNKPRVAGGEGDGEMG